MANYRQVHVKIWAKPWFEQIDPDAKLLFIYLITNAHRNEACVYQITTKKITDETNLNPKRVEAALRTLVERDRIAYDFETATVWVVNAIEYQAVGPLGVKAITRNLSECPSAVIREMFVAKYGDVLNLENSRQSVDPLEGVSKGFPIPLEGVSNGFANPSIQIQIPIQVSPTEESVGSTDPRNGSSQLEGGVGGDQRSGAVITQPPTREEMQDAGELIGLSREGAGLCWDHYESQGWVKASGQPIRNWRPLLTSWKAKQHQFQPRDGPGSDEWGLMTHREVLKRMNAGEPRLMTECATYRLPSGEIRFRLEGANAKPVPREVATKIELPSGKAAASARAG